MAKRTIKTTPPAATSTEPAKPTPAEQAAAVIDTPTTEAAAPETPSADAPQTETAGAEIVENNGSTPVETHSTPAADQPIADQPTAEPEKSAEPQAEKLDPKEQWKQSLQSAKDDYINAAIRRREFEEQLKIAKTEEKGALERVQRLIDRGPAIPASEPTEAPSSSASASPSPQPPAGSDDWKFAKIAELNLKAHLEGKLTDADITTIGQLEERRAEISQGRAKWPKGIGEKKITEIEDALVAWLTKNRDAAVFDQAASSSPAAPTANQASSDQVAVEPEALTADNWDSLSDEKRAEFLNARATQISENAAGENSHLDQRCANTGFWQSGYEAHNRGDEVADCPIVPGVEQDDWLRGYFAAAAVEDWEPAKETTSGELVATGIESFLGTIDEL